MNDDLFSSSGNNKSKKDTYTAQNIEVLDWSEAVRLRPGMYIGGKDINALHHLVAEVFDNAMDEAVAGHASKITIQLFEGNIIKISDNGRGIPIDPHPKFPDKSALEVILTTLHSGGKFDNKSYETSGGLHGVGISVVNALSDELMVEVVRDGKLYKQNYSKGKPITELTELGKVNIKQGTFITFHPDPEIFGRYLNFKPKRLYNFAKSKAYLFQGVKIHWECDKSLLEGDDETPAKEVIYFPHGLQDYLNSNLSSEESVTKEIFAGIGKFHDSIGKVEWAIGWKLNDEGFSYSYCNTILTPQGGTHEAGFKAGLLKSLKNYGDMTGNKKVGQINIDDLVSNACIILSIFIQNPQFQGQTKEKLLNSEASKLVENVIKDRFDHWLSSNKTAAELLLNFVIEKAEDRRKRKVEKEVNRKSLTHRIILPGKLADCKISTALGTELFIVEGDSAGGSAKQARNRENQAILPLRGKILNVANATSDKIISNQQLQDLTQALGCGTRKNYSEANLRYEKIIIMTDADVDGAHIASLLMTYFFIQMPKLVENGHLYLAKPPLYRLTQNNKTYYANNDKHKDEMVTKLSKGKGKIDIGRFKGLGEMTAAQLKETTMDPKNRNLIKIVLPDDTEIAAQQVENLMGSKAETRFQFIQEQALAKADLIKGNLDA
jgi:topoisomerase-4 subunit B